MSEGFWLKTSLSDEVLPPKSNKDLMKDFYINDKISNEVFRNDTTAVNVIIKQINNKNNKMEPYHVTLEQVNSKLCDDIADLKRELNQAYRHLEETKNCCKLIMFEIGKQLEAANQRELKRQTKYLVQQLEKEKLKTILESKTNLVRKLRKELLNVKRIVKVVVKAIRCAPFSETTQSDQDYGEFEKDLKTKLPTTSMINTVIGGDEITYESTLSSNV